MNILTVQEISRRIGPRLLFENISFGLSQGQKVAIIAPNGTGKTTLLRTIAGNDRPDTGEITFRNDLRVAYLPQEPEFDMEQSAFKILMKDDNDVTRAIAAYESAMETETSPDEMQRAIDKMDALQAWDYEAQIHEVLGQLQLTRLNTPVKSLSGGQRKRLALARVLLEQPDLLLLDEPTNHLDLDMIEWLEGQLSATSSTILMVTHDRYFLERVCNEIIEIDNGQLYRYKGNYSYFLEKKDLREESEVQSVLKAKNLMRKELEWIRRMPKARGTKSKSRVDAFDDIKQKANSRKLKEELDLQVKTERLGTKTVEFHNVSKSFGDLKILDHFTYTFQRKEKLGIVGANGTGKSTFLELLNGKQEPDGGKIVIGDTIKIGYFRQDGQILNEDKRVIEVVTDIAEVIPMQGGKKLTASQLLERFLFSKERQYQFVSLLSGGEKRRLYLLTVLMANPNFLILDEPTNDLDIQSLNALEDFLQDFNGNVVIVSHDRYFMDKIVDHLFVFQGQGKVRDFPGNYTQYREKVKEEVQAQKSKNKQAAAAKANQSATPAAGNAKNTRSKMTYGEKLEYENLEGEIADLETKVEAKAKELQQTGSNNELLLKVSDELTLLQKKLESKTERWMELAEKAEG